MKDDSYQSLVSKRDAILEELGQVGPFVQGSLCKVKVKCGNPECRCARGETHEAYVLSKKVRGKTVTTHVPRDLVEEVKTWAERHKNVKRLIKEISELSEQIIRGHVRRKRGRKSQKRSADPAS